MQETPTDNCVTSCSFLYFFLRVLTHWFYFTPKPFLFPPQPITYRPYIAVILGVNMLCLLSHLIFAPPAAGEATRGYLHGGLLIDFVGQKSPVKRWQFMGLDILVLVLQVLVLGVTIERRAINTEGSDSGNTNQIAEEQRQDHDFEERGMLRQRGRNSSPAEEYEMHTWARDHEATSNGEDREHDIVSQQRNVAGARDRHPLDPYYTGEHVIANLYLINTIRAQWQSGSFAVGSANASTSSVRAAVAAAAAGRTLTSRLSEGIQNSG